MQKYGVNQLRELFLSYFEKQEHLRLPSFSLIPHGDKSLLLINSGMAPMKPYFTGAEIPPRKRVTTCQKSIRTGDIENVGKTARHLTFFEMLGNFSFGDYFKKESIHWTWEFLTKYAGLSGDRLYPSIYSEDDEAFDIWTQQEGIPADRITRFYRDENGDCDNFWEHGAGPCGPCSEVYYDRGARFGCGKPDCKPGCDCDRYMEVWNNVFTQYESDGHHHYTELAQKNIDTGMGLERLAVVVQDVASVYDIDTMKAIRTHVCELSGAVYVPEDDPSFDESKHRKTNESVRLITDHIRSVTFMACDGIIPSNEGRGYVLRRLLRRAARHGRLLGIKGLFLANLCETVINESKDGYPELAAKREYIHKVLTIEEERFAKTIDQGLEILKELIERQKGGISGDDAFKLYDTFGFPLDLTVEIAAESGLTVDVASFDTAMAKQKETARSARSETNYMGADATVYDAIDAKISSVFVGYDKLEHTSKVIVVTTDTEIPDVVTQGQNATIIAEETPFYATMGGQQGDIGRIESQSGGALFAVADTIKLQGGKIAHVGVVEKGEFRVGDTIVLQVSKESRNATCQNHSATHLLHEALRQVLGEHVEQAGSLVAPDRLRFDFTHFSAMSKEEIARVEGIVNAQIQADLPVQTQVMSINDAKQSGAKALFGEKYGESVRVVEMGAFSKELCGGTHVEHTGVISRIKILSEGGVAAGVRRIEALTGEGVYAYYEQKEELLKSIAGALKTEEGQILKKIEHVFDENKQLHAEIEASKSKAAGNAAADIISQAETVGDIKVLSARVDGADMNALRTLGDTVRDKLGECAIFLASESDGKVSLIAMATEKAIAKGAHSGNLIKSVAACVGGSGGGKPAMAQAGGKNPAGIDDAVSQAWSKLRAVH